MARIIRLTLAVAAEKLADMVDAARELGAAVSFDDNSPIAVDAADDDENDTETRIAGKVRGRRTAPAPAATPKRVVRQARPNNGAGKVVTYTPAGTAAQIRKTLESLRGGTMTAFVFDDLAKHPGSRNAEVRERLAKKAAKAGLSVESVDNVIWKLTKDGLVEKEVSAE